MSRPKRHDKRITTAVRFSPETHQALQKAASDRDLSVNWLVNRAVDEFLQLLIPVEELRLTRRDKE